MSGLGAAIGLVGLGLLANALFCPRDKKHEVQEGWVYCPHCGSKLEKEGETQRSQ